MSIFTLKDGRVQVDPVNLTIPQFKVIYERDKSKDKEVAFNELCYIYHMADYKSVYNNYTDLEKEGKILGDYFKGSKWIPDDVVKEAIEKYRELQETLQLKLLQAAREATYKLITYYKTVDLNALNSKGDLIYKERDFSFSLGNVPKVVEALDKCEERAKKEQTRESRIRGGGEVSDYERS